MQILYLGIQDSINVILISCSDILTIVFSKSIRNYSYIKRNYFHNNTSRFVGNCINVFLNCFEKKHCMHEMPLSDRHFKIMIPNTEISSRKGKKKQSL